MGRVEDDAADDGADAGAARLTGEHGIERRRQSRGLRRLAAGVAALQRDVPAGHERLRGAADFLAAFFAGAAFLAAARLAPPALAAARDPEPPAFAVAFLAPRLAGLSPTCSRRMASSSKARSAVLGHDGAPADGIVAELAQRWLGRCPAPELAGLGQQRQGVVEGDGEQLALGGERP